MIRQMNTGNRKQGLRKMGFVAAACGCLSVPALAEGPGWTAVSTVLEIVNTANGGFNIRVSPALTDCVSQSGYGGSYASVYPNHPGIDRMKADMLVAFATGAKVSLYLVDNTCTVGETRLHAG